MSLKKKILFGFTFLLLAGIGIFCYFYNSIYSDNVNDRELSYQLLIPDSMDYNDLLATLKSKEILIDHTSFDLVAKMMSFRNGHIPSGKYKIENKMSNRALISMLRSGKQSPVNLTFNNVRTLMELAGKITANIELDSTEMINFFHDSKNYSHLNYTQETLMTLFIPNTYKVYWNINPEELLSRMSKEHEKFWNSKRLEKASKMNLTKEEVYTLASIVEKESVLADEKPRIAGVYYNRIQRGIPLQADPTVIFAVQDFSIRRVLNKHLKFDSPYNTYLYSGLPPGPIGMPSISGINAVLDYEEHQFIYFCVKPDGKGRHAFAKTLAGHNRNATAYRKWLNSRGIRR